MDTTLVAMTAVTLAVTGGALGLGRRARPCVALCLWIVTFAYFGLELVPIVASTVPYDPLRLPMSALGVTSCGEVSLSGFEVCSPLYPVANWLFVGNGAAAAAAALSTRRLWPAGGRTVAGTVLLVAAGWSNAATGLVPADVDLAWHVVLSLPGMVTPVVALPLLAATVWRGRRGLSVFTLCCAAVSGLALATLVVAPDFLGGGVQRLMYASVWGWGIVAVLWLWRYRWRATPADTA